MIVNLWLYSFLRLKAWLQQEGRASSHQRDKVGEGQLDLDLHLVFRLNHWANILVVTFEQVADQMRLLITLHCMKKQMRNGEFACVHTCWNSMAGGGETFAII